MSLLLRERRGGTLLSGQAGAVTHMVTWSRQLKLSRAHLKPATRTVVSALPKRIGFVNNIESF